MANLNLKFLRGLQNALPTTGTDGYFYLTTDTHRLYTSVEGKIVPVNEGVVTVANIAALNDITANAGEFFYATQENVLCVFNGQNFIQINAQKTLTELGGVAQSVYDEKILALEQADSNNATAISGVDTRLQAAEEKLKSVATTEGLGELTDRVTAAEGEIDALQAASHTHAFKDTDVEDAITKKHAHTFADSDVEDAISKKHSHTFVESELNKIVEGDVAKWNGVVADHLTSADKTTLENSIKEAKKAGTDANTNIETYKVSNDARVLAVEEDIAEIVNGTNGILAQAKSYSDGKLATARTEISAEIDADVKVVSDALEAYKTSNNSALAGVKATAEAAAVKTEVETALSGKVDKVEGKDLISTSEITRLASVTNYDDTQVKADIAKKADSATMTTELGKKVDKVEGYSLVSDTEIERLAGVHNYDDTTVKADIAKKADSATMTTELGKKVDKVEGYSLVSDAEITRLADVDNYDDAEVRGLIGDNADAISALADKVGTVPDGQTVMGIITNIQENAYDDTEIRGLISDNADAIAAEKERAEGIEGGLRTDVNAIKGDYLKGSDKTELEGKIKSNADAISLLANGASTEEIDGVNDLINYVKEHGTEVTGMKADIAANTKAISDHEALAVETYETKTDAGNKLTEAKGYTDTEVAKDRERLGALEAVKDDYKTSDATLKSELQAEIDTDVKVVNDALEAYKTSNNEEVAKKANSADVYTKAQTYTQEEVNTLLANAMSWGEF